MYMYIGEGGEVIVVASSCIYPYAISTPTRVFILEAVKTVQVLTRWPDLDRSYAMALGSYPALASALAASSPYDTLASMAPTTTIPCTLSPRAKR